MRGEIRHAVKIGSGSDYTVTVYSVILVNLFAPPLHGILARGRTCGDCYRMSDHTEEGLKYIAI